MKNIMQLTRFNLLTGFVFLVMILSACSKDDTPASAQGSWRISYYFDTGDETQKFNGYTFSFNPGSQLVATNGSNTVTGTWSETSSKLIISFGSTPVFDDLNDDWLVEEKTATSIKLKEDNPLQDDKLHFTKL